MARVLVVLLILLAPAVHAEDRLERRESSRVEEEEVHDDTDDRPRRFDYSRFSDGPRRVPEPRGSSAARAEALGLGTRQAASRLLHARPDPRWVEAAASGGRAMPEHLLWPVELGRFGRGFGYVRRTRPGLRHNGVDIVADEGSVVRAVADGIVAYSDNGIRGYGNCVILVHPDGSMSLYGHNYRTTVQPGWRVRRGERIAFVGNTGISRGPHLHFEVRENGHPVDPLSRFDGRPWIDAYREWRRLRAAGALPELTDHTNPDLPADRGPVRVARTSSAPEDEDVGSVRHVHRMLREGARPEELVDVEGRRFSNVLWPVRGGTSMRREGRGLNIVAERDAPVRAAADGLVVFAGEGLNGVGKAVVLLHPNGWVTLYGSNETVHVEVGQQVQRGEWIARVGDSAGGAPHLHFQLRHEGRTPEIRALLAQVPRSVR